MTRYRIGEGRLGAERTVVVTSPDEATRVVLALRGATLLSWRTPLRGRETELTDGYRDEAELLSQEGVRNGLLAPFPNRVADGRYRFLGREHDLLPGRHGSRTVYHGFVREAPFELVDTTTGPGSARLRLRTTRIRPGAYPGYPFSIDVEVTYLISANEIDIEIRATNLGTGPAPYAAGWHPYFSLSKPIDDLVLRIPADTVVRTDDDLIPLAGESGFLPLDQCPEMDFRKPRRVGGAVIDACFTGLETGPDGRAETVLSDPATGAELRVWQLGGFLHLFTGDTLNRNRRDSIALEPVEAITNAFNRAEFAEALRIEPGRERRFRFGVSYGCKVDDG
ncbi:aldose 1-epimerase [Streptomyces sp. NBC_01613]|uniref:aldose 1-epimerase n=1 Tax=Streptomyces sp. NBC_01613 TaxID=2975896 RepID=UPI003869AC11